MKRVTKAEAIKAGLLLWEAERAFAVWAVHAMPGTGKYRSERRPADAVLLHRGIEALRGRKGVPTLYQTERLAREKASKFLDDVCSRREVPQIGERVAS